MASMFIEYLLTLTQYIFLIEDLKILSAIAKLFENSCVDYFFSTKLQLCLSTTSFNLCRTQGEHSM